MAWSFVQAKNGTGHTSSLAVTFTSNVTAGNLIVVAASSNAGGGPPTLSVSDGLGNTYNAVATAAANGFLTVQLFYAANVNGGACTVTVASTSITNLDVSILEYSGLATTSPLDGNNSNTGSSASPSTGAVSVSGSSELLVGAVGFATTGVAITNLGGATSRSQNTAFSPELDAEDITASVNAALNWSLAGSQAWAAMGASFKTTGNVDESSLMESRVMSSVA